VPAGAQDSAERVRALDARVRSLLRRAEPSAGESVGLDLTLASAREQLESRISAAPGELGPAALVVACALLGDVDALQREREEAALRQRTAELHRIHDAVGRLAEYDTAEAIERAPELLCSSCSFGRGMISAVVGSLWLPRRLHIAEGSDEYTDGFLAFVDSVRIPLAHTLLEAELVRRRVPALVPDPLDDERTFKAIVRVSGSSSYVAAPIMSRGRAIGLFHGDRRRGTTRLTDVDRDRISSFASTFGLLHEQSLLRARLAEQRRRSHAAFGQAEATLAELESTAVRLDEALRAAAEVDDTTGRPDAGDPRALRVQELLTAREREVLALMTEGATNTRIAEQLVIAEGTVKSHVKNILRKLRAPTRSAAVARYAHLTRRIHEHA
jgi:DNA-binding CsgD family transcriptional regulator